MKKTFVTIGTGIVGFIVALESTMTAAKKSSRIAASAPLQYAIGGAVNTAVIGGAVMLGGFSDKKE